MNEKNPPMARGQINRNRKIDGENQKWLIKRILTGDSILASRIGLLQS
jgi:hypothetical protein